MDGENRGNVSLQCLKSERVLEPLQKGAWMMMDVTRLVGRRDFLGKSLGALGGLGLMPALAGQAEAGHGCCRPRRCFGGYSRRGCFGGGHSHHDDYGCESCRDFSCSEHGRNRSRHGCYRPVSHRCHRPIIRRCHRRPVCGHPRPRPGCHCARPGYGGPGYGPPRGGRRRGPGYDGGGPPEPPPAPPEGGEQAPTPEPSAFYTPRRKVRRVSALSLLER